MKNYLKRLNNRGDTIVEVLVSLAILSLALSISYATASHSLASTRNAEEHSEALQILESQIESLRSYEAANSSFTPPNVTFCMTPSNTPTPSSGPGSFPTGFDASSDSDTNLTDYPTTCMQGDNNLYHVSIDYDSDSGNDVFTMYVRWDGVGTLGLQREELNYKLHQ